MITWKEEEWFAKNALLGGAASAPEVPIRL